MNRPPRTKCRVRANIEPLFWWWRLSKCITNIRSKNKEVLSSRESIKDSGARICTRTCTWPLQVEPSQVHQAFLWPSTSLTAYIQTRLKTAEVSDRTTGSPNICCNSYWLPQVNLEAQVMYWRTPPSQLLLTFNCGGGVDGIGGEAKK